MKSEPHNVHACVQMPNGNWITFRVGRAVNWKAAQDRFERLYPLSEQMAKAWSIAGHPIRHFNVRAAADPDPRWQNAIPVRQRDLIRNI